VKRGRQEENSSSWCLTMGKMNLQFCFRKRKYNKEKHVTTMNTHHHLKLQSLWEKMLTYKRHEDKWLRKEEKSDWEKKKKHMTLYPIFVAIPQQSMMLESLKSKPPFLSECLYPSSFCQFIFFEPLLAVASFYESVQAIRPATTTRPRGDKHSPEDK